MILTWPKIDNKIARSEKETQNEDEENIAPISDIVIFVFILSFFDQKISQKITKVRAILLCIRGVTADADPCGIRADPRG